MAQDIASDMNSDEFNSITDSLESMQIAKIIESSYFEMMSRQNWSHLKKLSTLDSSGDVSKPTHMKMPENTKELHTVNYDGVKLSETKKRIQEVTYLTPDEFLRIANDNNSDNNIVTSVTDFNGSSFLVKNNAAPTKYTSFDDEWLVFNYFDNTVDTTLQSSKTQCLFTEAPSFTLSDSFIPDIPVEAFSGLLAEAKSACFARIKEAPDAKSEQQARRQQSWLSRKAWTSGEGMNMPNYGRN